MPMQTRRIPGLLLATLTLVCAPSCARGFDQVSPQPSSRGVITRADLTQTSYASAHHAIEALRPNWLWRRGNATISNPDPLPIVYVDGVRRGDLDELYFIAAEDVDSVTLLSPADATTLWGTGHLAGAIHVRTLRGEGPVRRSSVVG